VIASAEGLLVVDPNDLDSAGDVQAATGLSNPELMAKYAALSRDLASRAVKLPKPPIRTTSRNGPSRAVWQRGSPYSEFTLAAGRPADLMTVADHYMSNEKDLPKVLSYSLRILDLMQTNAKP
jgi:hypothetical protein